MHIVARRVNKISLNDQDNYLSFTYSKGTNASSSSGSSSSGAAPSGGETIFANYSDGAQVVRIYDKHKNLLEEKVCGVKQLSKTYDAMNRVDTIIDGETNRYYQYTYDDYDRLCMISETNANGEFIEGSYQEEYTYDIYGNLTKKQINSLGVVYENTYKEDSSHTLEKIAVSGCAFKPKKDKLDRNSGREVYYNNAKICEEAIFYKKIGDHATMLPSSMYYIGKSGDKSEFIKYAYDKMGNITHIYENGKLLARYEYDALSRLVREDNKPLDKTTVWVYDNCGNILKKREFALTLDRKKELEEIDFVDNTYVYDGDKLLSYNGNACRYNAHGNPTLYRGKSVSWRCIKQLVSYDGVTFSYDGFGRRIKKNDIKYVYDSANRLIKQYRETTNGISEEMLFFYDMTGVAGFTYSGAVYLYRKDVQGNIIAILNSNGEILARYFYDAWGNHTVEDNSGVEITDTESIAHLNPFRYRGYYYDTETNLYYLKARYYDPDVGRFISMDDIAYLNPEAINGLNLYAYCGNNPVMHVDENGNAWWEFWNWDWQTILVGVGLVVTAVAAVALSVATFGAGTPVAMGIVAGVTLAAGVLTGINGIATIGEGISGGYNFVRDGLFNEVLGVSDDVYNIYSGVVEGVAIVGSMILGVYQLTGRAQAARYGRKFLGKGYNKVGKSRWASADGLRQMIFDDSHHFLDGVRTTTHFNLYTHAANFLKGKSDITNKLHVFYNLFKMWLR